MAKTSRNRLVLSYKSCTQSFERFQYPSEWFDKLVDDCKAIVSKAKTEVGLRLLKLKWELGDRIIKDYQKFGRRAYGNKTQKDLAIELGFSQQEVSRLIRFRKEVGKDFDSWLENTLTESKLSKLSWRKIYTDYLPSTRKRENKLRDYRTQTRLSIQRNFPEERSWLIEILRNEKPILRTKEDIDIFWRLVRQGKDKPSDVYIKHYYSEAGENGRGWHGLPYWLKVGLEVIASRGESSDIIDIDSLAVKVLSEYIYSQGVTDEDIYRILREELKRKWCITDD